MKAYRGAEYFRAYRARRQAEGTVPHGTDNGYVGCGCRCDDCRRAHRDARRAERAEARNASSPSDMNRPRTRHSPMTSQPVDNLETCH